MRLILSNSDARRARELLASGAGPVGFEHTEDKRFRFRVGDEWFPATARREPSGPGRLVIEDMDGEIIAEAE